MKEDAWHDTWSQVDETADPGFFVRFLDSTRKAAVRAANANPRKFFDYLNVRPGDHIIEVGCGTGDLLTPLAELVGPTGRIVGVDKSRTMIEEARQRAQSAGANVEFLVGDIEADPPALDLPPDSFHHALAVSVWQHLDAPYPALKEMIRLTRPGGRITITETDWDTQIVRHPDLALTRKILHFFTDSLMYGAVARELPTWMRQMSLEEISVTPLTSVFTEPDNAVQTWLVQTAQRAAKAGVISENDSEDWIDTLLDVHCYFSAFTSFRVSGKKVADKQA